MFGEVYGKLPCVCSWGYSCRGADNSPDSTGPCSFSRKQLCPTLARVYFSILRGVKFWGLFCVTLDLGETTGKWKINGKTLLPAARKIFFPLQHENKEECQLSGLERRGS